MTSPRIGSSFSEFLDEEGILEETTAHAIVLVLAWRLQRYTAGGDSSPRHVERSTCHVERS